LLFSLDYYSAAGFSGLAVALLASPCLIAAAARTPAGVFTRACAFLGVSSYPVYTLHVVLAFPVLRLFQHLWPAFNGNVVSIVFIALMLPFAACIDFFCRSPRPSHDRPCAAPLSHRIGEHWRYVIAAMSFLATSWTPSVIARLLCVG
jgi:peptidoglycan/LPS O-acetylase OafA/YrhL